MLEIFQGKKKEYNELILKSLIFGSKTTNQIGKYVQLNRRGKPIHVKTIIMIISRKGSRLRELETKGYIYRKDKIWNLTFKGLGVALTFFDSLTPIYPQVRPILHSFVEEFKKRIKKNPTLPAFFKSSKFIRPAMLFESQEFLQLLKDVTNELIKQGTDLNQISEENFCATLLGRVLQIYVAKSLGLPY